MFTKLCWSFNTEIGSWLFKVYFGCLLPKSCWRNPLQSRMFVLLLGLVMFPQPPVLVLAFHGQQTLPQLCLEDFCVHTVSPWQFSSKLNTQIWHLVAPNKLIMEFWRLEKPWCAGRDRFCPCVLFGFQKWTSACAEQGLTHIAATCWQSVSNMCLLILVYCDCSFWWNKGRLMIQSFNFNLSF